MIGGSAAINARNSGQIVVFKAHCTVLSLMHELHIASVEQLPP
jgi:hypothetical protein